MDVGQKAKLHLEFIDEFSDGYQIKQNTNADAIFNWFINKLSNIVENRVSQPSELLPCPFCGGEGHYFCWDKPEGERYDIVCEDCPARSPIYETMEDAKNFWNKRASQ